MQDPVKISERKKYGSLFFIPNLQVYFNPVIVFSEENKI